jgi:hypothetical protein
MNDINYETIFFDLKNSLFLLLHNINNTFQLISQRNQRKDNSKYLII